MPSFLPSVCRIGDIKGKKGNTEGKKGWIYIYIYTYEGARGGRKERIGRRSGADGCGGRVPAQARSRSGVSLPPLSARGRYSARGGAAAVRNAKMAAARWLGAAAGLGGR